MCVCVQTLKLCVHLNVHYFRVKTMVVKMFQRLYNTTKIKNFEMRKSVRKIHHHTHVQPNVLNTLTWSRCGCLSFLFVSVFLSKGLKDWLVEITLRLYCTPESASRATSSLVQGAVSGLLTGFLWRRQPAVYYLLIVYSGCLRSGC